MRPPILAIDGSDDAATEALPGVLERLFDGSPAHPDRRSLETPIGDDDRTPIEDTTEIPYRRICQINYKTPRPGSSRRSPKRGTGWLIGPRLLLTAGHVILDIVNKGEPENLSSGFVIAPGRNGKGDDAEAAPYGLYRAARLSAHPRWLAECDPDYDIGCIHLDRAVPGRVGHWGFAAFDDAALVGAEVNIAGYPVEGPPERDGSPIHPRWLAECDPDYDIGAFAVSALTAAADSCDGMIARLLRRCRVQQRLDLWSSILTLVLGSTLFAASQAQDKEAALWLGIGTVAAAIVSLIAKRMGGGEGGLMAKYVDLHSVSAEARLHADTLRHKRRSGIAVTDADTDKALDTTRRLTKEKGWMEASDFLFPDDGFMMSLLGGGR